MFNEYLEVITGDGQKILYLAIFPKIQKNLFLLIMGWLSINKDIKNL